MSHQCHACRLSARTAGVSGWGTAAVWWQEGQYLPPAMWLPEFISVISITPGICNRCQNGGGEEKQKGAWESILMRKKRGVHTTRTARSQSAHGPPQHFPTGSKLSHLAWFPKETTVMQSCSMGMSVHPTCFNLIPHSDTFSKMWTSKCFPKQEDTDVLGATGLQWDNWACGLRDSLLVFKTSHTRCWTLVFGCLRSNSFPLLPFL